MFPPYTWSVLQLLSFIVVSGYQVLEWYVALFIVVRVLMSLRVVVWISMREYYVVVSYTLMRCSLQPTPQSLSMLECEQL